MIVAVIAVKVFLKFAYANKAKDSITSQKLGSRDFWRIANNILKIAKTAWYLRDSQVD